MFLLGDNLDSMCNLGEYITRLREQKGWTLRELARKSGLSLGAIQKIENGTTQGPGIDALLDIASALNMPITKLITAYQGKDPDKQPSKEDPSPYKDAVKAFFRALPDEEIAAIIREKGKEILTKLDEMDKNENR